jgi:hypothetical protein
MSPCVAADIRTILTRIARAVESVVPELSLKPHLASAVWLADDGLEPETQPAASLGTGEYATALGFEMKYRGEWLGAFEHTSSGSDAEQVQSVVLELLSQVQDVVAEATTEPWPLVVVNGRKEMAMPNAAVEGERLHMWYGEAVAPALRLPSVDL